MQLLGIFNDIKNDIEEKKVKILQEDDETLLLSYKISDYDVIYHNVWIHLNKHGVYTKISILADLSSDWNFNIESSKYEFSNNIMKFVETERSFYDISYDKNELKKLDISPVADNVFSIYERLRENNIPHFISREEGYFRTFGNKDVDKVIDNKMTEYSLYSFFENLDPVINKAQGKYK